VTHPHGAKTSGGENLRIGLEGICERIVLPEWTLAYYNSNWPAVFSTPAMIALMEMAASIAIQPALSPGTLSVGTRIEVDHIKAMPAGVTVIAKAILTEVNGRRLIFDVDAKSSDVVIGRGRIHRALIDLSRFMNVAAGKPSST
jgi:fluoroacetyl-CoA thioesterase